MKMKIAQLVTISLIANTVLLLPVNLAAQERLSLQEATKISHIFNIAMSTEYYIITLTPQIKASYQIYFNEKKFERDRIFCFTPIKSESLPIYKRWFRRDAEGYNAKPKEQYPKNHVYTNSASMEEFENSKNPICDQFNMKKYEDRDDRGFIHYMNDMVERGEPIGIYEWAFFRYIVELPRYRANYIFETQLKPDFEKLVLNQFHKSLQQISEIAKDQNEPKMNRQIALAAIYILEKRRFYLKNYPLLDFSISRESDFSRYLNSYPVSGYVNELNLLGLLAKAYLQSVNYDTNMQKDFVHDLQIIELQAKANQALLMASDALARADSAYNSSLFNRGSIVALTSFWLLPYLPFFK